MAEQIRSVRVEQVDTEAGPTLYEVHALWDTGPWRVRTFFSHAEAQRYSQGLLEGLDAVADRNTIFEWHHNDTDT